MGIDIKSEQLVAVKDIPLFVPERIHLQTCWNWVRVGVRGVKLATILIGGRRFTSKEAIERFLAASNAKATELVGV